MIGLVSGENNFPSQKINVNATFCGNKENYCYNSKKCLGIT